VWACDDWLTVPSLPTESKNKCFGHKFKADVVVVGEEDDTVDDGDDDEKLAL
jgi:hypothetical protein